MMEDQNLTRETREQLESQLEQLNGRRAERMLEATDRTLRDAAEMLAQDSPLTAAELRLDAALRASLETGWLAPDLKECQEAVAAEDAQRRSAQEGTKQISFGMSVEERCKINQVKNAVMSGNSIAADHRLKELEKIRRDEAEKKRQEELRKEAERKAKQGR